MLKDEESLAASTSRAETVVEQRQAERGTVKKLSDEETRKLWRLDGPFFLLMWPLNAGISVAVSGGRWTGVAVGLLMALCFKLGGLFADKVLRVQHEATRTLFVGVVGPFFLLGCVLFVMGARMLLHF